MNTELALSLSEFRKRRFFSPVKVKVLVILGNSEGINVKVDRQELEQLDEIEVKFLCEPQRLEINKILREESWTILLFSGHSFSQGEEGIISINKKEQTTIKNFKYGLKSAIERGLQLAIFNSCDGLKLAEFLAELQIPQTIVMREPVPDNVAQEFLKFFLRTFAKEKKALHLSVRETREWLHDQFEDNFPGISGLPVIWQNPAASPLTWSRLTVSSDSNDAQETPEAGSADVPMADGKADFREEVVEYAYSKMNTTEHVEETIKKLEAGAFSELTEGNTTGGRSAEISAKEIELGDVPPDFRQLICYQLGKIYLTGSDGKQDYAKAFNYFKQGAELESPECQYELGMMYLSGKNPNNPDRSQALHFFQEAANRGFAPAMEMLASHSSEKTKRLFLETDIEKFEEEISISL